MKKIVKLLSRYLTPKEIEKFLHKPQSSFLGLSIVEFISLNPSRHTKIVIENLNSFFNGEIMGA